MDNEDPTDPRGKFVIRCSTPPQIEEAIYEISTKVNALHDRTCGKMSYRRGRYQGSIHDADAIEDDLGQTSRDA